MQLWDLSRIINAEASPAFAEYQRCRERQSETSRKGAATRRRELLAAVEVMPITVERIAPDRVLDPSLREWEAWRLDRRDYRDGRGAPDDVRARWAVNYVRHNLTAYDHQLAGLTGKIGVHEAVSRLRERIFEQIIEVYPEFANEARRQVHHPVDPDELSI